MYTKSYLCGLGVVIGLLCNGLAFASPLRKNSKAAYRANTKYKEKNIPDKKISAERKYAYDIHADFIYWSADMENGMVVARNGTQSYPDISTPVTPGQSFVMSAWDPGFKFGMGLTFPQVQWDFDVNYTYLATRVSKEVSSENHDLFAAWTNYFRVAGPGVTIFMQTTFGGLSSVKTTWKNYLNVIDFELGRKFVFGTKRKIEIRPELGLKGTWQHERWVSKGVVFSETVGDPQGGTATYIQKQSCWGIGPRTGVKGKWFILKCLNIYGDFAFSGLISIFRFVPKTNLRPNSKSMTFR